LYFIYQLLNGFIRLSVLYKVVIQELLIFTKCLFSEHVICDYCLFISPGQQIRNTWKVLKCGTGEGWRRSVGPIM